MSFKLLHNRLILTLIERPSITKGGIILPNGEQTPNLWGIVEEIGPKVTMAKVKDIVSFYAVDAQKLDIDGILYAHIREDHLVGVYKEEEQND